MNDPCLFIVVCLVKPLRLLPLPYFGFSFNLCLGYLSSWLFLLFRLACGAIDILDNIK